MKKIIGLCLVAVFINGCAIRGNGRDNFDNFEPVVKPYSRNFIVAAPTYIGNAVGMIPVLILQTPIFDRVDPDSTLFKFLGILFYFPVFTGGFITGSAFIPFSYLCDENPWMTYLPSDSRDWKCKCSDKEEPNQVIIQDPQNNTTPTQQDASDNKEVTISDRSSGLMWKKCVEGSKGESCGGNAKNYHGMKQ